MSLQYILFTKCVTFSNIIIILVKQFSCKIQEFSDWEGRRDDGEGGMYQKVILNFLQTELGKWSFEVKPLCP
jgi:hypothetical protein